jgi:hypothetical protein
MKPAHQRLFDFKGIILSSDFNSGNLLDARRVSHSSVLRSPVAALGRSRRAVRLPQLALLFSPWSTGDAAGLLRHEFQPPAEGAAGRARAGLQISAIKLDQNIRQHLQTLCRRGGHPVLFCALVRRRVCLDRILLSLVAPRKLGSPLIGSKEGAPVSRPLCAQESSLLQSRGAVSASGDSVVYPGEAKGPRGDAKRGGVSSW